MYVILVYLVIILYVCLLYQYSFIAANIRLFRSHYEEIITSPSTLRTCQILIE